MKKKYISAPNTLKKLFPDCTFIGQNKIADTAKLFCCEIENSQIFEAVELKDLIIKNAIIKKNNKKDLRNNILSEEYFDFLKNYDNNFFDAIKIAVCIRDKESSDFVKNLFEKLHAEVICIYTEEVADFLKLTVKHRADIGFYFFENNQKIFAINSKGQLLDGDEILYLLAWQVLGQNAKGQIVVGTHKTNLGIENKLRALGVGLRRITSKDSDFLKTFENQNCILGATQSGIVSIKSQAVNSCNAFLVSRILASVYLENKHIWEKVKENKYVQIEKEVDLGLFERTLPKEILKTFVNFYGLKLKSQGRVLIWQEEQKLKILVESTEKTSAMILAIDIKRKIIRYLKSGGL